MDRTKLLRMIDNFLDLGKVPPKAWIAALDADLDDEINTSESVPVFGPNIVLFDQSRRRKAIKRSYSVNNVCQIIILSNYRRS